MSGTLLWMRRNRRALFKGRPLRPRKIFAHALLPPEPNSFCSFQCRYPHFDIFDLNRTWSKNSICLNPIMVAG